MNSYLRAVGFSNIKIGKSLKEILSDVFHAYSERSAVKEEDGTTFVEYTKNYGPDMGVKLCGILDSHGFHQEYYFPYFRGKKVSTQEEPSVEKHGGRDSYAGVCEDVRMGVSIIFYVQNAAEYKKKELFNQVLHRKIGTNFSGLSLEGKILLPIVKTEEYVTSSQDAMNKKSRMLDAAKQGDEEAIESLTLEDMDMYSIISRRIQHEDVFSIIDTLFMPYGMECDNYQVIGNILDVKKVLNPYTKECVWQLDLECNNMNLNICINEKDLLGEPEVGRRFKGVIWLQGYIGYL